MKKRALLSLTDKSGLIDFARGLSANGFELISTGGTAKAIRDAGLHVLDVAEVTGFPEMLDGRVKTLHPFIHGGLLGDRRLDDHVQQMEKAGIQGIDLLAVNLYAFEATINKEHSLEEAIESIDIGGPAMIRAASKNWANVTVVVDPADYSMVLESIGNGTVESQRLKLAAKAFRHTAYYDSIISRYLTNASCTDPFTETLTVGYRKKMQAKYGENSHQNGALYTDPLATPGVSQAEQIWGQPLSYNNILDADGAWELVCDLQENACVVIKHGNPCGVAIGKDKGESYRLARSSDPISAFGGITAFNGIVDVAAANAMTEKGNFLEVVIGTDFEEEALNIFKERSGWGQNVRLLKAPLSIRESNLTVRTVRGGALIQDSDEDPGFEFEQVTDLKPTAEQMQALKMQWAVVQHVKSNAIVIGNATQTLGVGAGQMNRVQSVELACKQAGEGTKGAVLASDAFFPFPDSIERAHEAGIAAIVQPGGSKKDQDVIDACNRCGIVMVLTKIRHFRH